MCVFVGEGWIVLYFMVFFDKDGEFVFVVEIEELKFWFGELEGGIVVEKCVIFGVCLVNFVIIIEIILENGVDFCNLFVVYGDVELVMGGVWLLCGLIMVVVLCNEFSYVFDCDDKLLIIDVLYDCVVWFNFGCEVD